MIKCSVMLMVGTSCSCTLLAINIVVRKVIALESDPLVEPDNAISSGKNAVRTRIESVIETPKPWASSAGGMPETISKSLAVKGFVCFIIHP